MTDPRQGKRGHRGAVAAAARQGGPIKA